MRLTGDPDATVVIRPRRLGWALAAGASILCVAAVLLLPRAPPAALALQRADEAAILAAPAATLTLYRFAPSPAILVAVFPSLHAQALTLNRAAVFVELAGAPRDRVPDDAALRQAISAAHIDFDHFYYGHDYRAADLDRMWTLADAQGLALNAEEAALRGAMTQASTAPGGFGALISLPPPGPGLLDEKARIAILRHELSHGLYFTDAAYARATADFWRGTLSETQRAGFRRMLGAQHYDIGNEDLTQNEMQAYLVNTPDPRFFKAERAGINSAEAVRLRAMFVSAMPPGWLRARE